MADERPSVFEYVCDHVIPGCTTKERGPTKEAVLEEARRHLEEHHGLDYIDDDLWSKVEISTFLARGGA